MHKRLLLFALFLLGIRSLSAQESNAPVSPTPVFAVKSNLLYDATTSMNLGVEFKTAYKRTFELPVTYNPWTFSGGKKFKHILVQPELRWWLCEPFSGHYWGVHAHYAYFNVGGIGSSHMKKHRYEGWLAGAGISYGYQYYFAPRWNLDLNIGVGYAYLHYEKYDCATCGEYHGKKHKNYFGPTKAAVSLIYLIK